MLCDVFQLFRGTSWSPLVGAPISKSKNFISKYIDGIILSFSLITVCFADKCYRKIKYFIGLTRFPLFTAFSFNSLLLTNNLRHFHIHLYFSLLFFICSMPHGKQNRRKFPDVKWVCAAQPNISREKVLIALNTGGSSSWECKIKNGCLWQVNILLCFRQSRGKNIH